MCAVFFFFQAEDGIRDLVRSRGLGDVYKRQVKNRGLTKKTNHLRKTETVECSKIIIGCFYDFCLLAVKFLEENNMWIYNCLLYTSDAADERSSVDLGGRRIIKKKNREVLDR